MNPARSDLRKLVLEIGVPLLLLAAVEMGLRSYVARPGVELMPRLFQAQLTTAKYLAYRPLAAQSQRLDILLMGMSQMMRVSAASLCEQLEDRHGVHVTAFNFAAPGESIAYDTRLLEDILLAIKQPRIIVYGLIPTNLLMEGSPEQTLEWTRRWPIFAASASSSPAARLQLELMHRFDLLLYREAIRDLVAPGPRTVDPLLRAALATDPRGDTPILVKLRTPPKALSGWERKLAKRLENFDQRMQDTPLFSNLERLAAFLRARDIQLVVLNNTVNTIYPQLLPGGLADYRVFVERLRQAAERAHVPFFDPVPDGFGDPQFYADATHYNDAGVSWITAELADFLVQQGIVGPQE